MKLKDLRKAIEGLPDDLPLVTPGSDHSFNRVTYVGKHFAERNSAGHMFEYFNDANMFEGSEKIEVFEID